MTSINVTSIDVTSIDVTSLLVLGHAGPGATWQAMLVVAGVTLTGFLLAAAADRIVIERADDLVVPLATTAIVSSLGAIAAEWISDGVGWGLPLAVVSLLALLIGAFTDLDLRLPSPLPMGALALAAVSAVILHQPLSLALHPPADLLPLRDDAEVAIVEPADDGTVTGGPVTVVVEVTGGSIGPGGVDLRDLPDDPEEAGALAVGLEEVRDDGTTAQQQAVEVLYAQTCTVADPCERVSFEVDAVPGTYRLTVEFVRGDGTPLAPFVRDRTTFTVE